MRGTVAKRLRRHARDKAHHRRIKRLYRSTGPHLSRSDTRELCENLDVIAGL